MKEFDLERIGHSALGANVGVPLPSALRTRLERTFAADLSAIRIIEADLRRWTHAPAFAYGHCIYVQQGCYQPETAQGQFLLAHEAAHVVQQFEGRVTPTGDHAILNDNAELEAEANALAYEALCGSAPTSKPLRAIPAFRPERPVIQCALGFEFQTGWQVFLEIPPRVGKGPPVQATLPKETMLYGGRNTALGWSMETDGRDIEFVIDPPIPESRAGAGRLLQVFSSLHAFLTQLQKRAREPRLTPQTHPMFFSRKDEGIVIVPNGQIAAQPQVTIGVRLSRIHVLMEEMARLGLQANNKTFDREGSGFYSRQYLKASNAAAAAGPVNGQPPSNRLRGLVAMVSQYLNQGAQSGRRDYAKDMAYAMARTDWATMFAELPPRERTYFQTDPDRWVRYALFNSGIKTNTGSERLIKQGITDGGHTYPAAQLPLTREQWLRGMAAPVNPIDRFTAAANLNDPAYLDYSGGHRLRAPGMLGNRMDPVGNNRSGVIIELRQMQRAIPFNQWPGLANRIMDYLIRLNGPMPSSGAPQF